MKMKVRKRQSVLQVHGAHCEAKREDMDSSAPRFLMEGTGQGLQQRGGTRCGGEVFRMEGGQVGVMF